MPISSRQLALRELSHLRKSGDESYPRCLSSIRAEAACDERDRALAERIFTGVFQNREYIDFALSQVSNGKFSSSHPVMKDILRLSAYQIMYLDRIPHRAAVSEGVNLARRKLNPGAAGFANAVLRRLAGSAPDFPEPPGEGTSHYLSVKYSHPKWLADMLIERIGYEKTADFFRRDNQPPDITIQINTLKCSEDEFILALIGTEYRRYDGLGGCVAVSRLNDELAQMLKEGRCFVQDISARMAVVAAEPKSGDTVLDTCAAPGGKSFSAAVAMRGEGRIISADVSQKRLELLKEGAERLEIDIIECCCGDSSDSAAFSDVCADVVIVDAPCSGFGTIRKKPEIRSKQWSELSHLYPIQRAILSNAAKSVKKGGTLIYSTCTVFHQENEEVVDDFLSSNPEFVFEDFSLPAPFGASKQGRLTIWPWMADSDGFFVAKMRRI